jgi:hypothetical protein
MATDDKDADTDADAMGELPHPDPKRGEDTAEGSEAVEGGEASEEAP